jgi:hypothetical protein
MVDSPNCPNCGEPLVHMDGLQWPLVCALCGLGFSDQPDEDEEWGSPLIRYTWVCVKCHAGWENHDPNPRLHKCGTVAQLRGFYGEVSIGKKG